ncbi:MAG: hypothetical protein U1B83_08800 [Candidatus Cloacimonadaceae bacterium]|nr:hypothetical protein [Candidatus Cloacimonadaceae bacterium]
MEQIHRQLGPQLFNQSWDLLLKPDRTREEDNTLINIVHASLYHWRQFGEPINILRGEWMICHVYTLLEHREEAYYHAMNIINLRDEIQPTDWDEAYALEAIARVHALLGNQDDFESFFHLAKMAGEQIAGDEDRKQFMSDFADGPWFGMISPDR